ncbi:MAG: hypothetical protein DA329_10330 [Candidatus Nitrosocosmicus sp.]|nr:hypothetical protein [Candidatus Nitrosocosmicus sp.]
MGMVQTPIVIIYHYHIIYHLVRALGIKFPVINGFYHNVDEIQSRQIENRIWLGSGSLPPFTTEEKVTKIKNKISKMVN